MEQKSKCVLDRLGSDKGGIIHVANIKGGVGKSTIATNLAAALSAYGSTLIIDLDVQGSATHAFGIDPSSMNSSSWELFKRRFRSYSQQVAAPGPNNGRQQPWRFTDYLTGLNPLTRQKTLGACVVKISENLSIIPATSDLFKFYTIYNIYNLVNNIRLCREHFKFIILDTPSVWNSITRALYLHADLNLIPVTLSALSTRSLRDYLKNVRQLTASNPSVRVRIIKNEVFGRDGSLMRGKARTNQENRLFLESLCEQVVISNKNGVSLLPQSIILDLEIPESSMIRTAQDLGKSVLEYRQNSSIAHAFDELAARVRNVLNNPVTPLARQKTIFNPRVMQMAGTVVSSIVAALIILHNDPVSVTTAPVPIAPQQLTVARGSVYEYTFNESKSLLKLAKFAICRFCAIVPSNEQINEYLNEIISIYNMTRRPDQTRISDASMIPRGTMIKFYPPLKIGNPESTRLVPVYQFFTSLVRDTFAYVTGDWCERGYGGGTPHYGIDVATPSGTPILAPYDGIAYVQNSTTAGRMVAVAKPGMVLFFAHMDKRHVKNGQVVKKGEPLGTVGMTGITSGPHVHVGYGLETPPSSGGSRFGPKTYKLTDPKLFFYREHYMAQME